MRQQKNNFKWPSAGLVELCRMYLTVVFAKQRLNIQMPFPLALADLEIERIIVHPSNAKPVGVAVYKDYSGGRFLVKTWHGTKDDFYKLSLRRESYVCSILGGVTVHVPGKKWVFTVPAVIQSAESRGGLIFIRKYSDAKILREADDMVKNEVLWNVIANFSKLAENVGVDACPIPKQSIWTSILSFFLFIFANVFRGTMSRATLLRAVVVYIKLLGSAAILLLCGRKQVLVHRDLHVENILFNGTLAEIIDVGECITADPLMEYVFAITAGSMAKESEYLNAARRVCLGLSNDRERNLFLLLLLVRSLGLLSEPGVDRDRAEKYVKLVNFILNYTQTNS